MSGDNSNRDLLIKVQRLKNLLVSKATGKPASDEDYVALRGELMLLPPIAEALRPTYRAAIPSTSSGRKSSR
jgi:hypothetical protein